jgi:hypothetical protein
MSRESLAVCHAVTSMMMKVPVVSTMTHMAVSVNEMTSRDFADVP